MQSLLAYIRSLFSGIDDHPAVRTSVKRDRNDDGFELEDESPSLKRIKQLKRSNFPDVMGSNDGWDIKEKPSKVRYVPIQVEAVHPSTSTPNEVSSKGNRPRTVPIEFVEIKENGPSTPCRKPRMHTPVRPIIHAVIDDEDEEVTLVESKPAKSKKKIYVDLSDEENDQRDEVIFVKRMLTTPPPIKPYKYFITTNNHDVVDLRDDNSEQYYRINRRSNDRNITNTSPRTYSKFRAPAGVSKTYKRVPTPVPRWLQTQKGTSLSNLNNKFLNINGNTRTTLSEVFNLDEKRNYQELIRKVTGQAKPISFGKPVEIVNLADDAASFRMTQKTQKRALDEIKQIEKDMSTEKENEETKEYDPVTVASINSSDSEIEIVPSESSTSSLKINPVNSLKDSYKDRPVTADNWLAKLDTKYRKKRQETQEKLKDARRESDIISKINYEQKLALLEHKIKHDLCIPESLIEEIQPSAEFPELTLEQEKLVKKSLGPGPPGQVLVEKFNLRITRRDLQTLSGSNWLNDEVINFYMNLLMERSQQTSSLPRVYATNTFFYPKLMQGGQAGLRRWTRKVDIFSHDLMVIPVHLGVHWCLSLVDFRRRRVAYLDSMGGRNQPCLDALLQYLRDEHHDKKGQPFDDSGWKMECLSKDIPQQMNGSDCGMFACTFAEFACRDAPYTFTQTHMPYLRRKAALEILTGKLLL